MTACTLHKKAKNKLKFVTLDKESNMSTMWQREEFLRICSKYELAEKARDIEATIPIKKSQETQYNFNLKSFSKIVSGAGDRIGSQLMRLCRSYIF